MGGRGSSSINNKSEMETLDDKIYNGLRRAGIPKEILLRPTRRVVKAGNQEYDMNEMTDEDVKGMLNAFNLSLSGVRRVLQNYNGTRKLSPEQKQFYADMQTSEKNLTSAIKAFEDEKKKRGI